MLLGMLWLLLCCAVLCCAVLCCAVLCCAVLCCAVKPFTQLAQRALRTGSLKIAQHRASEGCIWALLSQAVHASSVTPVVVCFAGMMILQRSLQQNHVVRKMLKVRLEEARTGRLNAEKEHARAAALAASLQHDLELLKQQVTHWLKCATSLHIHNSCLCLQAWYAWWASA